MKNKMINLLMLFVFSSGIGMAQNNEHKMSDTQKAQAAKADVYIINSKKKIKDSLTTADKDTTVAKKPKRNHSDCRAHRPACGLWCSIRRASARSPGPRRGAPAPC